MKKTHTSFLMKAAKSKHTKTLAAYLALNFIVIQAVFFPGVAFAISDPIDSMQTTLTQSTVPVSTNEPTPTPTLTESTQDDTTFLSSDATLSVTQDTADPMSLMTAADDEECGGGCLPDCPPEPPKPPVLYPVGSAPTIDANGNAVFMIGISNLLSGQMVRLALADDSGMFAYFNMYDNGYGNYLFSQNLNRLTRYRYYFLVADAYGNNLLRTQENVIEPTAPPIEPSLDSPSASYVTETTAVINVNAQLPVGYQLTARIIQGPASSETTMESKMVANDSNTPNIFRGWVHHLVESSDYQIQVTMTDKEGNVVKTSNLFWFGTKGVIDNLETLVRHHPATRRLSDTRYNANYDFNDDRRVDAFDQLMIRNLAQIAKTKPEVFDRVYSKIMAEVSTRIGAIRDAERPTGPVYEEELDVNHDGQITEYDLEMIRSALIKIRVVMGEPVVTSQENNVLITDHIDGIPAHYRVWAMIQDPSTGEWLEREMTVSPWQNQKNPLDVDGNGTVNQADGQLVVDRLLTATGAGPVDETIPAPPYYDVNGDGMVSARDALLVSSALLSGTTSIPSVYKVNLDGLPPETDYQYHVRVMDWASIEISKTADSSFTTLPPVVSIGVPAMTEPTDTAVSVSVNAQLPIGYSLTLQIVNGPTTGQIAMVSDTSSIFTGALENLKPGSDYQVQVVMTDKEGDVVKTSDVQNLKTQKAPPAVVLNHLKVGPFMDEDSALIEVYGWIPSSYTLRLEIVDGPTNGNIEMKFNDGNLYPQTTPYEPIVYDPVICLDGYVCGNAFIANLENLTSGSDYQVKARVYDENGTLVKESDPLSFRTYDLPSNFINEPVITFDGTKASVTVSVDRPLPDRKVYFVISDPVTGEWRLYEFLAGLQNQANPLDANGDGTVNDKDPQSIINLLNGTPDVDNFAAYPDVNADGSVNSLDALLIYNYLNSGTTTVVPAVSSDSVTLTLEIDNLIPGRQYYYRLENNTTGFPECDSRPSPLSPCATGLRDMGGINYSNWFIVPQVVKPVKVNTFSLGPMGLRSADYMTLSVTAEASGLKENEKLFVVIKGPGGPFTSNAMLSVPVVSANPNNTNVYDSSVTYSIIYNGHGRFLNNSDYTFTVQKRDVQGKVINETAPAGFHTPPALANSISMHVDTFMINQCDWPGLDCSVIEVSVPNLPPQSAVFLRVIDEAESLRENFPTQLTILPYTPIGGGNATTTYRARIAPFQPGHTYRYYIEVVSTTDGFASDFLNATVLAATDPKTFTVPNRMAAGIFTNIGSFEAKLAGGAVNLLQGEEAWLVVKDMQGRTVTWTQEGNFSDGQYFWLTGLSPDTDYTYDFELFTSWTGLTDPISAPVKFRTKPAPVIPIQVELTNVGYSQASFNTTIENLPESLQVRMVLVDDQFNVHVYGLGVGGVGTIPNLKPGTMYTYQVQVTYTANEIRPDGSNSARTIVVSKSEQATFTTRSESDPPYIPKPTIEDGMNGSIRATVEIEAVPAGGVVTFHARNKKTGETQKLSMNTWTTTWTGKLYYMMFSNSNTVTYGWNEELQQWGYTETDQFDFFVTIDVDGQEIATSESATYTLRRQRAF